MGAWVLISASWYQAAKCERQNAIADGKFLEVAVVHRLVTGSELAPISTGHLGITMEA